MSKIFSYWSFSPQEHNASGTILAQNQMNTGMKTNYQQYTRRLSVFVIALLIPLLPARAPAAEKIWRIGFLSPAIRDSFHDGFFKGLRELGYIEGRKFILQSRIAAANQRRLTEAAADLAKLQVDVIVARGTQATLAAKKATATIPM